MDTFWFKRSIRSQYALYAILSHQTSRSLAGIGVPKQLFMFFGTLSTMKSCTGSRQVFEQPRAAVPHCFQWDENFYTQKTRNSKLFGAVFLMDGTQGKVGRAGRALLLTLKRLWRIWGGIISGCRPLAPPQDHFFNLAYEASAALGCWASQASRSWRFTGLGPNW